MTIFLRDFAVRLLVLAGLFGLFLAVGTWLTNRSDEVADADIGTGLILFAILWGTTALWSFFDARRHGLVRTIAVWVAVGAALGAAFPLLIALADGEWDGAVVADDLIWFVPFWAISLGMLATCGAALGSLAHGANGRVSAGQR